MNHRSYTISHCKYGVLVSGPVPALEASALLNLFHQTYGYEILDGVIAEKTSSTFAITTPKKSALWRKQLQIEENQ